MLVVNCSGGPAEIGFEHGIKSAAKIKSTITFYQSLIQEKCKLDWDGACQTALKYAPSIHQNYPHLEIEMHGIAKGAGVSYEDILALNVRTELMFGLFSDGCTSLSWKTPEASLVAQNWDWMEEQKENLIVLNIQQPGKPTISMITEAGMVGKIGLNSAGLGLCVNAIRAAGTNYTHTPIHLCWRLILESPSLASALSAIEAHGCAAAAHILIADRSGSIGLEVTSRTSKLLLPDSQGRVFHTNHMLEQHEGTDPLLWLGDTYDRIERIRVIANTVGPSPGAEDMQMLLMDVDNYPFSINRAQTGKPPAGSDAATVFSIVIDCTKVEAVVLVGRPDEPDERLVLAPR